MKTTKYFLIFLILIVTGVFSCGRRIIPASVGGNQNSNYDEAAFSYVYIEAIKQKIMGNEGDALKYLEQCIKLNPKSDAAYYQMAQIVSSNGDIINGKKFIKEALSIDEKNIWYIMMLAGFYYQEKSLDSAIFCYESAIKYFPDKEDILMTLGNLYSENRNFESAKLIFDSFDKKYGVNANSTVSSIKMLMIAEKFDAALSKAKLLTLNKHLIYYN